MPKSIGSYLEKSLRNRARGSSIGAALAVSLDTIGLKAQTIEIWVRSSGPAVFSVYGSEDGVNWTYCDTQDRIVLPVAGQEHKVYFNSYRFVRAATPTPNDNEIEIIAQR